jgi:endonuclease YncB( thermonuclease family)
MRAAFMTVCAAALSISFAQAEDASSDPMPVASIEAAAASPQPGIAVGAVTAAAAPVITTERYRVHRSPVRSNSLAFHVTSLDGAEDLELRLPGVEGFSFNTICRNTGGARIACGSLARVQFVNLIARREVVCRWSTVGGQSPTLQSCDVDGRDLAEALVRGGIGHPAGDQRYAEAVREARQAERGMWVDAERRRDVVLASN